MSFEKSYLWKSSLAEQKRDSNKAAREAIRNQYLEFRSRSAALLQQISIQMPELTVHDISHIDALWEIASLIVGPDYKLNPAEAFVLGGAFLLHDAAMSLAAYPNGEKDLIATIEWKDEVTSLLQSSIRSDPSELEVNNPPAEIRALATQRILRLLHAKQSEKLANAAWQYPAGSQPQFLIENGEVRSSYGPLIGLIAHSHWWDVRDLVKLPRSIGAAAGIPQAWSVDPLKLACILRVSDAAHIDAGRAPNFLYALKHPTGESEKHWNFQNKLMKPHLRGDEIVYSSGPEFLLPDAEAWWLAFDTIRLIDKELKDVDVLLEEQGKKRFAAKRVHGASAPDVLANSIRTSGWKPVNTELRVSNVSSLVRLLGGENLYGDDPVAAIRELIQNASDAIRARCLCQNIGTDRGKVTIRLINKDHPIRLEVEDNGVGMSSRVLTGPLLDFGKSLWSSDLVKTEFPGLQAKKYRSTGRFGIGFFSVFMLGPRVRVISRRYDAALIDTLVLDFRNGLDSRPILREPSKDEVMPEPGTKVVVDLMQDPKANGGFLFEGSGQNNKSIPLSVVVASTCPNNDISIEVEEDNQASIVVSGKDWLSIGGNELLSRIKGEKLNGLEKKIQRNLRFLTGVNGEIYGRAAISVHESLFESGSGIVTVGGLKACALTGISGILIGDTKVAARDQSNPIVPLDILSAWATEQAVLLSKSKIAEEHKLEVAHFVAVCGGQIGDHLPIINIENKYLNYTELIAYSKDHEIIALASDYDFGYDPDIDDVHPREFNNNFEIAVGVGVHPQEIDGASLIKGSNSNWPSHNFKHENIKRTSLLELILKAISEAWGQEPDEDSDEITIGEVNGSQIVRIATLFRRPTNEEE